MRTFRLDGLRVDTVKHVPKSFWTDFQTAADNGARDIGQSGCFLLGEIYSGEYGDGISLHAECSSFSFSRVPYVSEYQYYMDSALSFPMYYTIGGANHVAVVN